MSAYFELNRASTGYRWWLKNETGESFANAMRSHRNKVAALDEIAEVRRLAGTGTNFQIFREGRKYRWRLRTSAGVIVATSARSFTRAGAQRDAELAGRLIPTASFRDLTADPLALYALGSLPAELTIRWPAPPVTTREVTITAPATGETRIEQANTRIILRANLAHLTIAASDIDLQVESGVEVGNVFLQKGIKRIRFSGGRYGKIEEQRPADFHVTPIEWREAWLAEDLLFDGIDVDTARSAEYGYAFDLRGKPV